MCTPSDFFPRSIHRLTFFFLIGLFTQSESYQRFDHILQQCINHFKASQPLHEAFFSAAQQRCELRKDKVLEVVQQVKRQKLDSGSAASVELNDQQKKFLDDENQRDLEQARKDWIDARSDLVGFCSIIGVFLRLITAASVRFFLVLFIQQDIPLETYHRLQFIVALLVTSPEIAEQPHVHFFSHAQEFFTKHGVPFPQCTADAMNEFAEVTDEPQRAIPLVPIARTIAESLRQ